MMMLIKFLSLSLLVTFAYVNATHVNGHIDCPTLEFRTESVRNVDGSYTIRWEQLSPATTGGQVEYVDIHIFRHSGTNIQHLRMWRSQYFADHAVWIHTIDGVQIAETVRYSFTYAVSWPDRNTVFGCDTRADWSFTVLGAAPTTQAPTDAPGPCPTLTFRQEIIKNPAGTWTIQWSQSSASTVGGQVTGVELVVTRSPSGTTNVYQMTRSPYSFFPDNSVFYFTFDGTNGEHLSYAFAYRVENSNGGSIACPSATFTFDVPTSAPATTAPPSNNNCPTSLSSCGTQCYASEHYVCHNNNQLCPVSHSNLCGENACYNPTQYECVNGQLKGK